MRSRIQLTLPAARPQPAWQRLPSAHDQPCWRAKPSPSTYSKRLSRMRRTETFRDKEHRDHHNGLLHVSRFGDNLVPKLSKIHVDVQGKKFHLRYDVEFPPS